MKIDWPAAYLLPHVGNGGHAFHFLWKNHGEKSSFHGVVFVAIVRCTIRLTVCHGTSPVNTGLAEVRHWAMIDRAAQCATTRVVTRDYSKFSLFLLILAAHTAYRTPTPTYTLPRSLSHTCTFRHARARAHPALHRPLSCLPASLPSPNKRRTRERRRTRP